MQFFRSHHPGLALKLAVLALLGLLIAAPLARILLGTLTPDAIGAWSDALISPLSRNLFWLPLLNTMILGFGVAAGCVLLGGFLAWLVVMTDVPFRRTIGLMATLPFMIPSFAHGARLGRPVQECAGRRPGWLSHRPRPAGARLARLGAWHRRSSCSSHITIRSPSP